MKSEYKRFTRVGPGGWHCPCCAPAPGKGKRQFKRTAKRKERATMQRLIEKEQE